MIPIPINPSTVGNLLIVPAKLLYQQYIRTNQAKAQLGIWYPSLCISNKITGYTYKRYLMLREPTDSTTVDFSKVNGSEATACWIDFAGVTGTSLKEKDSDYLKPITDELITLVGNKFAARVPLTLLVWYGFVNSTASDYFHENKDTLPQTLHTVAGDIYINPSAGFDRSAHVTIRGHAGSDVNLNKNIWINLKKAGYSGPDKWKPWTKQELDSADPMKRYIHVTEMGNLWNEGHCYAAKHIVDGYVYHISRLAALQQQVAAKYLAKNVLSISLDMMQSAIAELTVRALYNLAWEDSLLKVVVAGQLVLDQLHVSGVVKDSQAPDDLKPFHGLMLTTTSLGFLKVVPEWFINVLNTTELVWLA